MFTKNKLVLDGFCVLLAVVDYEALRDEAARAAKAKVQTVREYVAKLLIL